MRQDKHNAVRFERNSFYERLIEMRRTRREVFETLSIPTKLALLEYEKQKRAHEQLGQMRAVEGR